MIKIFRNLTLSLLFSLLFCLLSTFLFMGYASATEFNFGNSGLEDNCATLKEVIRSKLVGFATLEKVPARSFSYAVGVARRHQSGLKGLYEVCIAQVDSLDSRFSFVDTAGERRYGQNHFEECQRDAEELMSKADVLETRLSLEQGMIFNPYCEAHAFMLVQSK